MPFDGSTYETEVTRWLIEGRENLLRYGWHPGPGAVGSQGRVCMLAALPVWGRLPEQVERTTEVLLDALEQLGHEHNGHPSYWQDMPGRTLGEVLAVYDRAIEISTGGNP